MSQIIEINIDNIRDALIHQSTVAPVVLEVYATSIPESKTLSPILVKFSQEMNFTLARINVETEREIAIKIGVQNVPEVHIWQGGKVVDGFNGTLSENEIRDILTPFFVSEDDLIVSQARESFSLGQYEEAATLWGELLRKRPDNTLWQVEQGRALLSLGQTDIAIQILNNVKEPYDGWRDAKALLQLIQFHQELPTLTETTEIALLYKKGVELTTLQQFEEAMKVFLEVVQKEKAYKDEAARKALLCLFQVLGATTPENQVLVKRYRSLLSMYLFS
jgi:putative thioredoxin